MERDGKRKIWREIQHITCMVQIEETEKEGDRQTDRQTNSEK
jgi:hypothetical protein